jgi:hypothetical protein
MPTLKKLELENGVSQQMPMKSRRLWGNNLKTYSNTLKNLEEIDKFLDVFDLSNLNQEDMNHLNRSRISNGIRAVMKSSNKGKSRTWWFTGNFSRSFKGELTPILLQVSHEIERKGIYQTHSIKPGLYSFQNQTNTSEENYRTWGI